MKHALIGAGFTFLLGLLFLAWYQTDSSTPTGDDNQPANQSNDNTGGNQNSKPDIEPYNASVVSPVVDPDEQKRLAFEREAEKSRLLAQLVQFRTQGEETEDQLKELNNELVSWQSRIDKLMSNDEGKRVAASAEQLELFAPLKARQRPSKRELEAWQQQLDLLMKPIQKAVDEGGLGFVPSDEYASTIGQLDRLIRDYREALSRDELVLDAMIKATVNLEGEVTLGDALAEQRRQETEAQLRQIKDDSDAALAKSAKEIGKAKAAEIEAENNVKKAKIEKKTAELKREAERTALEREYEASLADIKRYLRPFIADGYAQPNGYRNVHGTKKIPVSWSALKASGALEDSRNGMERLMYLATIGNDRYRGNFPKFIGGNFAWERTDKTYLAKAQELLNKFGQIMVDEELLSP